ncbi:MAG: peptidoglycan-binding protein [Oleibacter sp.]|nr:peptidoglycan-binding protein [Thalassolituus sp.]
MKQYLAASAIALLITGCASQETVETSGTDVEEMRASLAQLEEQNQQLREQLGQTPSSEPAAATQSSTTYAANASDMLPPNAMPGHCYARVAIPEVYETEIQQVVIQEATEVLTVEEANYETVEEQVLVKEGWTELVVVPATYKTVTETVLVKEASSRLVNVPAEYKTIVDEIVIRPAYTTWKKGTGPIQKINEATGEIMCLVEIPAETKLVERQELVSPARTDSIEIPAEYKEVSRRVVDVPAYTDTIEHPAVYETVSVVKLKEGAKEIRTEVPAVYQEVATEKKVSDARLEWREILCDTNTTPDVIRELQTALKNKSYDPGKIDGAYGWETNRAMTAYQKDNNLPVGQLTMQTLESLGVKNF